MIYRGFVDMRVLILCILTILSSWAIEDYELDHIVVDLGQKTYFIENNAPDAPDDADVPLEGAHSNLTNLTDLSERIWEDFVNRISNLHMLDNSSMGNIHTIFVDIFNKTCVEKLEYYNLGGHPLAYRMAENGSVVLHHFQTISGGEKCLYLGDGWTYAASITSLFHYDPLCIAKAMTPLVSYGKTIIAESIGIGLTLGAFALLSYPLLIPLW